ncbi:hypothetical protein DER46DRAFT_619035 [Fusarium sp. MPI-SDFR-AT-0072]|nr:hypothetical protein DER46DRAFT_619035 [Fusarium sp. MPI-SDFR-AT-0072]
MAFSNKSKKSWIIPQASLSPDDLVLGSILKRPGDPTDILNRQVVEPVDPSNIIKEREQVTKSFIDALDVSFGSKLGASSVLASIIGASPSLEGTWAKGVSVSIEATNVRAQHFLPSADYVNRALHTKVIDDYVHQSFFSAPVYMVVGVAVASKLSRTTNASSDKGGGVGIGISPPGTGIEVSAEWSATCGSQSSYHDSVAEDVVLAYRLRRFRYSRRRDEFIQKDEYESKHARYGTDQEDLTAEENEDGGNYVAVFSYFDGDDFTAVQAGNQGFAECDDDGDSSDQED